MPADLLVSTAKRPCHPFEQRTSHMRGREVLRGSAGPARPQFGIGACAGEKRLTAQTVGPTRYGGGETVHALIKWPRRMIEQMLGHFAEESFEYRVRPTAGQAGAYE